MIIFGPFWWIRQHPIFNGEVIWLARLMDSTALYFQCKDYHNCTFDGLDSTLFQWKGYLNCSFRHTVMGRRWLSTEVRNSPIIYYLAWSFWQIECRKSPSAFVFVAKNGKNGTFQRQSIPLGTRCRRCPGIYNLKRYLRHLCGVAIENLVVAIFWFFFYFSISS